MDDMELTPEEERMLDGFVDPDIPANEDHYKWDEEFQRELLNMLLKDRKLLTLSLGLVKPEYFTNEVHKVVSKLLLNYFEKYRSVPKKTFLAVQLEDVIEGKKADFKQLYRQEFNLVYDYYSIVEESRDFILDKIVKFAQRMAMKRAFGTCSRIMKENPEDEASLDKVREILNEAILVDRNTDLGLDYFDPKTIEERYAEMKRKQEQNDVFSSGFDVIDGLLSGGGLDRGEIGAWMGLSGVGKSLALLRSAMANMNKGYKVLYISLELAWDRVAQRFDAQIADKARETGMNIDNLVDYEGVVIQGLNDYIEDNRDIFGDDRQRLIIKQFPGSHMGLSEFRSYFQQSLLHGFYPDLVIVDYVGEMKDYPGIPGWESKYRIVRDLRSFAVDEHVCVLTALQPNKSAKEVIREGGMIDDENLADAFGQVRPLDAFWTLNQTRDESDLNIARGFVAKHRHGKKGKKFYLRMDPLRLVLETIGEQEYKRIKHQADQLRETTAAEKTEENLREQKRMDHFKKKQAEKVMAKVEQEHRDRQEVSPEDAMSQLVGGAPDKEVDAIIEPAPTPEEIAEKYNKEFFGEE